MNSKLLRAMRTVWAGAWASLFGLSPLSVLAQQLSTLSFEQGNLETTSETSAIASVGDLDGNGDLAVVIAKGRHCGDLPGCGFLLNVQARSDAPKTVFFCSKFPSQQMERETRDISGWQVHIAKKLLETEADDTAKALAGLKKMLDEIVEVVPASAVAEMKKVPLYFSPSYQPGQSGAEFHPGAGWLRDNGRDPAMAQGVEFTGVHSFEAEMRRMPNFALHELAHAFHFRSLANGFDNTEIKAAYQRAKQSGMYERVERTFGNGKPNTFERAYAMTNAMEYFAEASEAYFFRNDFFPFARAELLRHDPEMHALLEKLWGVSAAN